MLNLFLNPLQNILFSFSDEMSQIKFLDQVTWLFQENVRGAENILIDQKIKAADQNHWNAMLGFLLVVGKSDCK